MVRHSLRNSIKLRRSADGRQSTEELPFNRKLGRAGSSGRDRCGCIGLRYA
jgi:hypothetical protein